MRTDHTFTVPETLETVRRLISDVDRAVACVPGLTMESAAPAEYGGRLRLRAGATTVTYRGTARLTNRDGNTTTIEFDGQEARGTGTAKGVLTVALAPENSAATRVGIGADVAVTGRLGNLEPTVFNDVVQRLLVRFGECITAAVVDNVQEPVEPDLGEAAPTVPAASTTEPVEPEPRPALLAPAARRPVWPLRPMTPVLAAAAAVGVVVQFLRRRRRRRVR